MFGLRTVRAFHTSRSVYIIKNLLQTLENTAPKPFQVVQVNRPVGFQEPPTPTVQIAQEKISLWNRVQNVFDKDKKLAKRKELEDQMSKSGFHDAHYYTKYKGKMFVPPISFFKSDKSLYFPNLVGNDLTSNKPVNTTDLYKGKITVVRTVSSQTGEKHSDTYFKVPGSDRSYLTDSYDEFQTKFPHAQISELNLSENNLKHLLISFARNNLKKLIPEKRHHLYLTGRRSDLSKEITDTLLLSNKYASNLYVLDHNCKIRWLTVGEANDQERLLLFRCLSSLEKELSGESVSN